MLFSFFIVASGHATGSFKPSGCSRIFMQTHFFSECKRNISLFQIKCIWITESHGVTRCSTHANICLTETGRRNGRHVYHNIEQRRWQRRWQRRRRAGSFPRSHAVFFFFPTQIHTEESQRAQTYETARNRERDEHGTAVRSPEWGAGWEERREKSRASQQEDEDVCHMRRKIHKWIKHKPEHTKTNIWQEELPATSLPVVVVPLVFVLS